ncbi:MAG: STAS domain-containing protein [Candidatus Omnitrophica bacterium]|nr:STAS domain-containing protein [Candidatus Omnitrophota bacterium]
MQVKKKRIDSFLTVRLAGEMDTYEAENFEGDILKVIKKGEKRLIIDFEKLKYISSSGLRVLLSIRSQLSQEGGRLILVALKEKALEVFKVSKLLEVFEIRKDIDEALK